MKKNTSAFLILILGILIPWQLSAAESVKPVYEKINQYRTIKTSVLLWGTIQEMFVRFKVDKVSAYPGEPIILSYDLLSRVPSQYQGMDYPETIADFSNVEFPADLLVNKVKKSVFFKDRQYEIQTLRKMMLFAQSSGLKEIEPGAVKAVFRSDNQAQGVEQILASQEKLAIQIKDFPATGKPDDFSGLVGPLTVSVSFQGKSDSKSGLDQLRVEVVGVGDVSQLKLPDLKLPKGLTGSSNQEEFNPFFTNEGICKMKKVFFVNLQAENDGEFTIPSISVSYFDPGLGKYKAAVSLPFSFKLLKSLPNPSPSAEGVHEPAPVPPAPAILAIQNSNAASAEAQKKEASLPSTESAVATDDKDFHGIKKEVTASTQSNGVPAHIPAVSNKSAQEESEIKKA